MERKGDADSYFKAIRLDKGRVIGTRCALSLDGRQVVAGTDFFPLAGSPDGHAEGSAGVSLNERGLPWIYDLRYDLEAGKGNAGFELRKVLEKKTQEARKKGATALLLYNSSVTPDGLMFDSGDKRQVYGIPVVYIGHTLSAKVFKDATAYVDINLTVQTEEKAGYVHNVEGLIDNGAARTVVLRACLDTTGSGAALIELARLVKQAGWKKHNYLVLGYSGEKVNDTTGDGLVDYRMELDSQWLHVRYMNGGEGRDYPLVALTEGTDYYRVQRIRYIFKLMEAAEKQ